MKTALPQLSNANFFRLAPNTKIPAAAGWQNAAGPIPQNDPEDANYGLYCGGSGLIAIDVDTKHGDGFSELIQMQTEIGDLPETLEIATPSGGRHLIYRGLAKSSVGKQHKTLKNIDVKSRGGYVVAAGAVLPEGSYTVYADREIADAPESLIAWANERGEKTPLERPADASVEGSIPDGKRDTELTRWAGVLRGQGLTIDEMDAALWAMNLSRCNPPLDREQVTKIAESIGQKPRGEAGKEAAIAAEFDDLDAALAEAIEATGESAENAILPTWRLSSVNEAEIPLRDWVLRDRMITGFLSMLVAPGGVGKSTLAMLDAMAIASGRPMSGYEVVKSGPVLYINMEDPDDELRRRFAALAKINNVNLATMTNLHVMSGRTAPLVFAQEEDGKVVVNKKAGQKLIDYCVKHGITAIYLDPYIRIHRTPENSNNAGDLIAQMLQKIMDKAGVSICIVHHTRKKAPGQSESSVEDGRGNKAISDAARIAHSLRPMNEAEAAELGVAKRKAGWYMRLDLTKANLSAPAESAIWYERHSVKIENGETIGALTFVEDLSKRNDELLSGGRETDRATLGEVLDGAFKAAEYPEELPVKAVVDAMLAPEREALFGHETKTSRRVTAVVALLDDALETRNGVYNYLAKAGKDKHFVIRL